MAPESNASRLLELASPLTSVTTARAAAFDAATSVTVHAGSPFPPHQCRSSGAARHLAALSTPWRSSSGEAAADEQTIADAPGQKTIEMARHYAWVLI
jgi:hypothetical protein